jgi:hypothetical protein
MVEIVGIIGFKGSGKDTAGDYLVRHHGFQRDSFAKPLKDVVASVFGWERSLMEGATPDSRAWRETPDPWWEARLDWRNHPGFQLSRRFTPRVAMQYLGTDVLRTHFHDSVWIMSLESRIRDKEKIVLTDCRFPNEINLVRQLGGPVFRIKRGPEPDWYPTAYQAALGHQAFQEEMATLGIHSSEWACLAEPIDAVIENNGTIPDLEANTECLVAAHFKTS